MKFSTQTLCSLVLATTGCSTGTDLLTADDGAARDAEQTGDGFSTLEDISAARGLQIEMICRRTDVVDKEAVYASGPMTFTIGMPSRSKGFVSARDEAGTIVGEFAGNGERVYRIDRSIEKAYPMPLPAVFEMIPTIAPLRSWVGSRTYGMRVADIEEGSTSDQQPFVKYTWPGREETIYLGEAGDVRSAEIVTWMPRFPQIRQVVEVEFLLCTVFEQRGFVNEGPSALGEVCVDEYPPFNRLLSPDEQFPDLLVRDTDGQELLLSALQQDRTTVLVFWNYWCQASHKALWLAEFYVWEEAVRTERADVQVLCLDWGNAPALLAEYVQERQLPMRVYSIDRDLTAELGILGTPTTFVVGPRGRVLHSTPGFDPVAILELLDIW